MSSLIAIPHTSSELYIPVHKRNRSTSSSYSRTSSLSPLSSRGASPFPSQRNGVYTPAELLSLADSPLTHASGGDMNTRLRAIAPEVVQTRKQRKAQVWHARHVRRAPSPSATTGSDRRGRAQVSESEDDRTSWRA